MRRKCRHQTWSLYMKLLEREALKSEKGITYSTTQLWRLEKENRFPRSIKIGGGRKAWVESEIDDYIEKRIAERDSLRAPGCRHIYTDQHKRELLGLKKPEAAR